MTTTRILYKRLLTMGEDAPEDGELIVRNGVIESVSERTEGDFDGVTIDLSDALVMPGFVNAHAHLTLSHLHDAVPFSENFTEWAETLVLKNRATPMTERVEAMRRAVKELTRSGVTGLGDYFSHPELVGELKQLPFRQVAFLETLGFRSERSAGIVETLESVLRDHSTEGKRFRLGLAPHAPYSVSPQLFRGLRDLANRYACPFSCHVAEFPEEVQFLEDGSGPLREFLIRREVFDASFRPPRVSPVTYLDSLGVLNSMVAVHLNHVDSDLPLLKKRKVHAVFCPGSTRWFRRKPCMPARRMRELGIPVALGTDSLASNESLNFLRELRIAEDLLTDVSRREILKMATRFGAEALGMRSGVLEPGRPADLIAFREMALNSSMHDVPFDPGREAVDFVMLDGQVIFDSGSANDG